MSEFVFSFIKNIRVKLHPSLLVSCAGAVAIYIKTTSFSSTNKVNILSPSWNCDRQMVLAKKVIKLPNLLLLIKQRSLTGDIFLAVFDKLQKVHPRKVNVTFHFCSMVLRWWSLLLAKQSCSLNSFLKTMI